MNKLVLILSIIMLSGCVVGEFKENRIRMHEINSDKEICEKYPDRCISGIAK